MLRVEFATLGSLPPHVDAGAAALIVMPFVDAALARRAATQLAARAGSDGLLLAVYDDRRAGFVAVANRLFRGSASASFGYVAQDAFAGRDWLARGRTALAAGGGGLLAFNDGKWRGALAAFGLADRRWAAANYRGDLFHPGYRSHYADAELTVLALAAAKHRYDPESLLVEVDWDKEARGVDEADRTLFRTRAAAGFDGRVAEPKLLSLFG
jgi:hypothetical protein